MDMSTEMPKAYESQSVEDRLYQAWEKMGYFNPDRLPDRNLQGEPFCIMMPPPNVTGVLHLGHALENALMDTMARFERMRGKKVLIVPGTDHAALPTQAKVEKILIEQGMANPRQTLGREKLVAKIREFAEKSQATILSQVKKMGTSCDWSRLAFTFDEQRSKAVNELFIRMYHDGLIYRGYRVVHWSVKGQSTCSDDEVITLERPAKLYTFKYSKDFPITIATTRPETKLGDTAVAVHPKDPRYKKYIGQTFSVDVGAAKPLSIKIIADEGVEKDFGTGALGVTPAHSMVDFEMYEKQKAKGDPIDLIPVIGADGKMTEAAGPNYAGLSVEAASEKFVAWLKDQGLLEKEEEIVQHVGTSDRFGDVLEAIPMTQWWLDVNKNIVKRGKSLKDLMREAIEEIGIAPDRFKKLYLDRIEHLRDWCLSRQIWWGHRIPVWYKDKEIAVSDKSPGEGWEQDPDTLDTWFSSGSWTFSTLGWPDQTADLKTFHPTQWIQMGYEILYLWMMRMILMSEYALEQVPFHDVYIHGILRDETGKKYSKSSGDALNPLEIIKNYGCDALRWSVLIGSTPGNDSKFYYEKVEGARNLVNKLWNISRFILISVAEQQASNEKTLADEWILQRLDEVKRAVTQKLETFQFSAAGEELRDFTWSDLADWYVEIAKVEQGKKEILEKILQTVLKLWHPFMPFVTEEIWQQAKFGGQLIVAEWPAETEKRKKVDTSRFQMLRELITDMRRLRADMGVEAAKKIVFSLVVNKQGQDFIKQNMEWMKRLTQSTEILFVDSMPSTYAVTSSGMNVIGIDLAGAIDVAKERQKSEKELASLMSYVNSTESKLAQTDFVSKAPEQVIKQMQDKLAEAKEKKALLEQRLEQLSHV